MAALILMTALPATAMPTAATTTPTAWATRTSTARARLSTPARNSRKHHAAPVLVSYLHRPPFPPIPSQLRSSRLTSTWHSVVTQFKENAYTQFFVQNGKKISIPGSTFDGLPSSSTITPEYCKAQFNLLGDRDRFTEVGGFSSVNQALSKPLVLVMSIWDDVCNPLSPIRLPHN